MSPTDRWLPNTSYALLGLLSLGGELSGYDLKRWADASIRFFYWSPVQSQIYGELRRLARLGLVTSRRVEQTTRPAKTLFSISPAGGEELRRWLEEAPVEPLVLKHPVALRLFFGQSARPERLRELLEQYAAENEATIAALAMASNALTRSNAPSGPGLVAAWGEQIYGAEREAIRRALEGLPPGPA